MTKTKTAMTRIAGNNDKTRKEKARKDQERRDQERRDQERRDAETKSAKKESAEPVIVVVAATAKVAMVEMPTVVKGAMTQLAVEMAVVIQRVSGMATMVITVIVAKAIVVTT